MRLVLAPGPTHVTWRSLFTAMQRGRVTKYRIPRGPLLMRLQRSFGLPFLRSPENFKIFKWVSWLHGSWAMNFNRKGKNKSFWSISLDYLVGVLSLADHSGPTQGNIPWLNNYFTIILLRMLKIFDAPNSFCGKFSRHHNKILINKLIYSCCVLFEWPKLCGFFMTPLSSW